MKKMSFIRSRFGLRWAGNYPPVSLHDFIVGLLVAAVLIGIYAGVELLSTSQVVEQKTAELDKAEKSLVAMLNGAPVMADNSVVRCKSEVYGKVIGGI